MIEVKTFGTFENLVHCKSKGGFPEWKKWGWTFHLEWRKAVVINIAWKLKFLKYRSIGWIPGHSLFIISSKTISKNQKQLTA